MFQNFGIDYKAFSELIDYCPLDFLRLAFRCCQVGRFYLLLNYNLNNNVTFAVERLLHGGIVL